MLSVSAVRVFFFFFFFYFFWEHVIVLYNQKMFSLYNLEGVDFAHLRANCVWQLLAVCMVATLRHSVGKSGSLWTLGTIFKFKVAQHLVLLLPTQDRHFLKHSILLRKVIYPWPLDTACGEYNFRTIVHFQTCASLFWNTTYFCTSSLNFFLSIGKQPSSVGKNSVKKSSDYRFIRRCGNPEYGTRLRI